MGKKMRPVYVVIIIVVLILALPHPAFAQDSSVEEPTFSSSELTIGTAMMCEGIGETGPKNPAIVFPIAIGTVFCFTSFDSVPKKTFIYHHWFRKDRVSTRIKLALNPPQWSTYSSVRLREEDKGPWRVEIRDETDLLLQTLRFSITD